MVLVSEMVVGEDEAEIRHRLPDIRLTFPIDTAYKINNEDIKVELQVPDITSVGIPKRNSHSEKKMNMRMFGGRKWIILRVFVIVCLGYEYDGWINFENEKQDRQEWKMQYVKEKENNIKMNLREWQPVVSSEGSGRAVVAAVVVAAGAKVAAQCSSGSGGSDGGSGSSSGSGRAVCLASGSGSSGNGSGGNGSSSGGSGGGGGSGGSGGRAVVAAVVVAAVMKWRSQDSTQTSPVRAYKLQLLHQLKPDDCRKRANFCDEMIRRIDGNPRIPTDEELEKDLPKVNVWLGMHKNGVIDLFFFMEPTVTGVTYLDMLENFANPPISKFNISATYTTLPSRNVKTFLDVTFSRNWIDRGGLIPGRLDPRI
ncbi:hypothetical protein ANN_19365 [Periplaneta americana]|uniref:Uncharacterized protein n=1 Tax=Periplaneta americana TaxID=6978 RepID=A0ABQ8SA87_PERAM|nr:hypothetical protein ANN_19365 [Periplaneta americana]